MTTSQEGILLKIILDEEESFHHKPLYEQIVFEAKKLGLSGATVFKGIMGYCANKSIHSAKLLRLAEDLPIIIEIIDSQDNIDKLMPFINEHIQKLVVTMTTVKQLKYQPE
ncbi:DUF190 domain-containing protein [bacterium]|nr:DUF190 domain-containing protein [bacterium]